MRRMGVLAILGGAALALIVGTAFAGEQPSVAISKKNALYVPPTDGPGLWLERCYPCHRPWGHIYEVPNPSPNPPESNPDNQTTQMLRVHNVSDHLVSIPGPPAPAWK